MALVLWKVFLPSEGWLVPSGPPGLRVKPKVPIVWSESLLLRLLDLGLGLGLGLRLSLRARTPRENFSWSDWVGALRPPMLKPCPTVGKMVSGETFCSADVIITTTLSLVLRTVLVTRFCFSLVLSIPSVVHVSEVMFSKAVAIATNAVPSATPGATSDREEQSNASSYQQAMLQICLELRLVFSV